jgi:hypothetical protein
MPDPVRYLQAMGAAAGASVFVVLALGWSRPSAGASRFNVAGVLAVALGLLAGYGTLRLRLSWPPANALDRLLTIVLPAVIGIELLAGLERLPRWGVWLLRIGLALAVGRILWHGSVYLSGQGAVWQAPAALVLCGALLGIAWFLLLRLDRRSPGVSLPLALALAAQCGGIVIMLAGYVSGGAAALPLVAALAATALASIFVRKRSDASGTIGIGLVGLFGLLFIGRFFGGLSTGQALAVFLAPLLCWGTELPFLRTRRAWIVGCLRLGLVALPLLAVLIAAKRDFDRDTRPLLGASRQRALP